MGYYEEKEALMNEALQKIHSESNPDDGWKELLELAEEGYAPAQGNLADFYLNDKNYKEAFEWYSKAANNGDVRAQFNLSIFYQNGIYVQQDLDAKMYWLEKAGENGYGEAASLLANIYLFTNGDAQKGPYWAEKAAEAGDVIWQCNLGTFYLGKFGFPKDIAKAKYWTEKAAEQGDTTAYCNMGNAYDKGLFEPDARKAIYWFERAATVECHEQAHAAYRLALIYYRGNGITPDDQKAFEWMSKAAELGNAYAMIMLGAVYNGIWKVPGIGQNLGKSAEWFLKSAEAGNIIAMLFTAQVYHYGQGVEKNLDTAEQWYQKTLNQPMIAKDYENENVWVDAHKTARERLVEIEAERKKSKKKKWFFW